MPMSSTVNFVDGNTELQLVTPLYFLCVSLHVTEEKMYRVSSWFFQKNYYSNLEKDNYEKDNYE